MIFLAYQRQGQEIWKILQNANILIKLYVNQMHIIVLIFG